MFREEQASKYGAGVFLITEPSDIGQTIVEVNASGYCTVKDKTTQPFHLLLVLYTNDLERTRGIPAECDTSTNDTDTVLCQIQSSSIRIHVPANHSVGILFDSMCSSNSASKRCTCRPATLDTATEKYTHMNTSEFAIDNSEFVERIGLQLSFTVRPGETT